MSEWIEGLPTEPGRCHFALQAGRGGRWVVTEALDDEDRFRGVIHEHEKVWHAIKHKPASPLPAPPEEH